MNLTLLIAGWLIALATMIVSEIPPFEARTDRLIARYPRAVPAAVLAGYVIGAGLITAGFMV